MMGRKLWRCRNGKRIQHVRSWAVKSVTDFLPEELMDPSQVGGVINYLKAAPLPSNDKVRALIVWSHQVGAKVSASQRAAVAATGTDNA